MNLSKVNEQALRLFLTGEVTDLTSIADRVGAKRSHVAAWARCQDWSGLKARMTHMVKEGLTEKLGSTARMNANHLTMWGLILLEAGATLVTRAQTLNSQELELLADSLVRAAAGIRLAAKA